MNTAKSDGEGESNDSGKSPVRKVFAEFMAGITRLEELVAIGGKFLSRFQESLDLIRRPQTNEMSELVKSVIEGNESKRMRAYMEGGCAKTHDRVSHMCAVNSCFEGLSDYLVKAKEIMGELKCLMSKAGIAVQVSGESVTHMNEDGDEIESGIDDAECCSFMATIYCMVEKDCLMQERIVSALNLGTSTEELGSYCLMWSLRPFVVDEVLTQALKYC